MTTVPTRALELIKAFEGFRAEAYICPAGVATLGYGSTGADIKLGMTITEAEATERLHQDCVKFIKAIHRLIKVPLNENQLAALISFTYNLGAGALQRSSLRAKLNRGEYEDAAEEFLKWVNAGGRKLAGLVRRRLAEQDLFMS